MSYILKDHLGSASAITDSSGASIGTQRYYPFGETRLTTGTMNTDKLFTGQRDTGLGIYYFNARFYSQKLGRFLSPDSIVPSYVNPQSLNRYSYVTNRPINLTDPTGHRCSPEDDCSGSHYSYSERVFAWKWRIKHRFGINMSDEGGKAWSAANLSLVYSSLENIDSALHGGLASLVGGATFKLGKYVRTSDCPKCTYGGWTARTTVTFYTMGNAAIRQMNIYHEFGHLIDNMPGKVDIFSNALGNLDNPGFVTDAGYLDRNALVEKQFVTNDPNYANVEAVQHPDTGSGEQWADAFANYVAGNIDLSTSQGAAMYNFVADALFTAPNSPPPPISN